MLVVANGQFNRITHIAQLARFGATKLHSAGHMTRVNIQARNNASGEHRLLCFNQDLRSLPLARGEDHTFLRWSRRGTGAAAARRFASEKGAGPQELPDEDSRSCGYNRQRHYFLRCHLNYLSGRGEISKPRPLVFAFVPLTMAQRVNILQITPGAGGMFCGNCFRDNALVAALRKLGHRTLLVPLYLPMRLDEEDQSEGTPIFFGGINVYLGQKSALFRKAPGWLRNVLASPGLLKWAAGKAAKTRAEDVSDLTLSMLQGENGNQARDLEEFLGWINTQPRPDVICLSNALLTGMARRLKQGIGSMVVCSLQGEDTFLDALAEPYRGQCWSILAERAREIDLFIAPSRYYSELMGRRLALPPEKIQVVYNGINLEGYSPAPVLPNPPVLGYFARMCREKGLDTLVDAYLLARERVPNLRLRVGGGCGPADQPFVDGLRARLKNCDAEFHPNLDREAKLAFLRSLTVFSVPALYGEAFGLYVLEALASGVPVVQPDTAAFPELIRETGGGVLCQPGSPQALATAIETVLASPNKFSQNGLAAVREKFSIQRMAENLVSTFTEKLGVK